MNGGYILIDLAGVDLATGGEVAGIYEACTAALTTGKPVIFGNAKKSDMEMSPIPGSIAISSGDIYYFTATGDSGVIASDESITPAETDNRASKSKK